MGWDRSGEGALLDQGRAVGLLLFVRPQGKERQQTRGVSRLDVHNPSGLGFELSPQHSLGCSEGGWFSVHGRVWFAAFKFVGSFSIPLLAGELDQLPL